MLRGAVAVADAGGIGSLTIRSLAQELGVKPMSVYHHVANKDEILDGIVDLVFSEIELPDGRRRLADGDASAGGLGAPGAAAPPLGDRSAGVAHQPRPATLRHHNAVIGTLRAAGFSVEMTAHAFALIDSYIYGFALSEAALPINGPDTVADVAESMMEQFSADALPAPASSSPPSTSCSPATTSATSSSSGST